MKEKFRECIFAVEEVWVILNVLHAAANIHFLLKRIYAWIKHTNQTSKTSKRKNEPFFYLFFFLLDCYCCCCRTVSMHRLILSMRYLFFNTIFYFDFILEEYRRKKREWEARWLRWKCVCVSFFFSASHNCF